VVLGEGDSAVEQVEWKMSTDYGYRCLTCGVDSRTWSTNTALLIEAYRLRRELIIVQQSNWFSVDCDYRKASFIDFLIAHGEHELKLLGYTLHREGENVKHCYSLDTISGKT
jgi:hypothetical protein